MEDEHYDPAGLAAQRPTVWRPRRAWRATVRRAGVQRPRGAWRLAAAGAAAVVLLGGGIGIGVALTGAASAANGPGPGTSHSASTTAAAHVAAARCTRLVRVLRRAGYPLVARRAEALCASRLLRLAFLHGIEGEITFRSGNGFTTLVFERGTVESAAGSPSSAAGSTIVVLAADGTSVTWHVDARTVVREDGSRVAASTVTAGDRVLVVGQVVGGVDDARLIRVRTGA